MTNGSTNTMRQDFKGTEVLPAGRWKWNINAGRVLKRSAELWFLTAIAGQWIFVAYIAAHPVYLILSGGLQGLTRTHMPQGYIPGDTAGNLTLAAHVFLAVVIIGGGPLQLIPHIRSRFPAFHRWNGRVYMTGAAVSAAGGFYLTWARPTVGNILQNIAISIDAVLIVMFAVVALRYALARKIDIHRRWALRLFMVVSAVWFLRIGYRLWSYFSGITGIKFERYFDILVFAQYLVPLAILEIYLRTRDRAGARGLLAMSGTLFGITVIMAFGIYLTTMNMWLPRILETN